MRKCNIRVQVWLNEEEKAKLHTNAAKSGLSQEAYLRILINGYVPKPNIINPMARINPKIKSDKLLTTDRGSLSA
jgi:hypothetical protein